MSNTEVEAMLDVFFDLAEEFGFISKELTFPKKSLPLLKCAMDILHDEHPVTLRQLYYRVVSAGDLEPTQKGYNRLKTMMGKLREVGEVPRTWIVDHIRATLKPSSWTGLADFGDTVREAYRKDYWASLKSHVEIIVEKDAVAGTLHPVTEEYDVALRVCRGYTSISFAGEIADQGGEIARGFKHIYAYYLGDYDPSGFDIERDLIDKLGRYSMLQVLDTNKYGRDVARGGHVSWTRLGVTESVFNKFDLIPLPIKHTDRRAKGFREEHGDQCTELDAIPPVELRRQVEEAILRHINAEKWARLQQVEAVEKEAMNDYRDRWGDLKVDLDHVSP